MSRILVVEGSMGLRAAAELLQHSDTGAEIVTLGGMATDLSPITLRLEDAPPPLPVPDLRPRRGGKRGQRRAHGAEGWRVNGARRRR